jgi:hypothetical protein
MARYQNAVELTHFFVIMTFELLAMGYIYELYGLYMYLFTNTAHRGLYMQLAPTLYCQKWTPRNIYRTQNVLSAGRN